MPRTYHKTENRRKFFKEMYETLDGRCMICGEQQRLVIDHNHTTGKMRGLLCYSHNAGLGMFQDNPEFLRSAADYLETVGSFHTSDNVEPIKPVKTDQAIITALLAEFPHESQRAVAKRYAEMVGITYTNAQTRINRYVRKLGEAASKS